MLSFRCLLRPLARLAMEPSSSSSRQPSRSFTTDKESSSSKLPSATSLSNRLVWVDCEMTGLDSEKDTILEVAVLVTDEHLNTVAEGPNLIVHHPESVLSAMGEWCTNQHGNSGLTQAVRDSKLSMTECEEQVLDFVSQHVPKGECPLAGNSVGQDAKFLAKYMPRVMDHLHYRIVDVSTVKEIAKRWYPEVMRNAPRKKVTHRALEDIKESVEELRFYEKNVFVRK